MFKLLEGDVCRGRIGVEVEAVGVLSLLVRGRRELLLAMVENIAPLGVDPVVVLFQHLEVIWACGLARMTTGSGGGEERNVASGWGVGVAGDASSASWGQFN